MDWFEKLVAALGILLVIIVPTLLFIDYQQSANQKGGRLFIFVDSDTGCQYLSTTTDGAIFPRIGSDGKHVCNAPGKATGV